MYSRARRAEYSRCTVLKPLYGRTGSVSFKGELFCSRQGKGSGAVLGTERKRRRSRRKDVGAEVDVLESTQS
jgi:hypothetical protein